jgi:hypothetical protein
MKAARQNDRIILRFAPMEARMLSRVFSAIVRQYEMKPEEVDPRVADVWYSKRGCASAGMDEEQTREWVQTLHSLKSANAALLGRWKRNLAPRVDHVPQLELTDDDSHTLVTVLNDHRLMCAARFNVGEHEMNLRSLAELQTFKPRHRMALIDIMFLAAIIETVLALLPGNYGDWPAHVG